VFLKLFSSKKPKLRSLKEEIKERAELVELLEQGEVFYEAKIVLTGYRI